MHDSDYGYPYKTKWYHRREWQTGPAYFALVLGSFALLCSIGVLILALRPRNRGEESIADGLIAGYLTIATGLFALPGLLTAIGCVVASLIRDRQVATLPNIAVVLNASSGFIIFWAMNT